MELDKSEVRSRVVDSEDLSFRSSTPVTVNNRSKHFPSWRNQFLSCSDGNPKLVISQSPRIQARKGGHAIPRKGLNRNSNMKSSPRPSHHGDGLDKASLVQLPLDISSSLLNAKWDRNINPLPHPRREDSKELCIGQLFLSTPSDSKVSEVHETKTGPFSPSMIYRQKTYYSDDELSWGDNSDIDDEDSFPFNPVPPSQPSGQV